ncbi:MAG: hypothetical protein CPDRYMAC_1046 [uncultured Paraburkholderia sp.]|nr:MAG: hypothetical protein CPDRYDRY_1021 [uncultured Paraburkholderia sp.]CAH2915624.1 MAG: hypothetical protein CPDRYMAC_1046 [uncultured Paraburkholderia sp.]
MPELIVSRLPALAEADALENGDVVVQPARLKPAVARAALADRHHELSSAHNCFPFA